MFLKIIKLKPIAKQNAIDTISQPKNVAVYNQEVTLRGVYQETPVLLKMVVPKINKVTTIQDVNKRAKQRNLKVEGKCSKQI